MVWPDWFTYTLLVVGLVFSVFCGLESYDVFGGDAKDKPWAWRLHQFWFNFAGSAAGWGAAWFVARKGWQCLAATSPAQLGWSDVALTAVTFVGITGHLPYATAGNGRPQGTCLEGSRARKVRHHLPPNSSLSSRAVHKAI